jgi:hypothetical protein
MNASPVFLRSNQALLKWLGLVLCILSSFSQLSEAQIQLGKLSFADVPAPMLSNPTRLKAGVRSLRFVGKVGGVAFGGTAVGKDDLKIIALEYIPENIDGRRLQVTVKAKDGEQTKVTPKIYDWELIPIARFAETKQDACFTLFGSLNNKDQEKELRSKGKRILNYHAAFSDSLLGLRLFQADILILRSDACDLPKLNGEYLLGKGEAPVNLRANQIALSKFHEAQQKLIQENEGKRFQSYVICDSQQTVSFRLDGDDLKLTGAPIWNCWRTKTSDAEERNKFQAEANAEANRILNVRFKRDISVLGGPATTRKWTKEFQQKEHSEIFDNYLSSKLLVQMPDFSFAVSTEVQKQGGINPAIYKSLLVTMRYSALFRHFQSSHPTGYSEFVKTLKNVKIKPDVKTPTVMTEP